MKNKWRELARQLDLDIIKLSHSGLTTRGQTNVMNNMHTYAPIDPNTPCDVLSLLMEMAWSSRAYERRNGCDGKYLQLWLAAALDSIEPVITTPPLNQSK